MLKTNIQKSPAQLMSQSGVGFHASTEISATNNHSDKQAIVTFKDRIAHIRDHELFRLENLFNNTIQHGDQESKEIAREMKSAAYEIGMSLFYTIDPMDRAFDQMDAERIPFHEAIANNNVFSDINISFNIEELNFSKEGLMHNVEILKKIYQDFPEENKKVEEIAADLITLLEEVYQEANRRFMQQPTVRL